MKRICLISKLFGFICVPKHESWTTRHSPHSHSLPHAMSHRLTPQERSTTTTCNDDVQRWRRGTTTWHEEVAWRRQGTKMRGHDNNRVWRGWQGTTMGHDDDGAWRWWGTRTTGYDEGATTTRPQWRVDDRAQWVDEGAQRVDEGVVFI